MIACYLELYKEEVEHINGVWPISKQLQLVGRVTLHNAHWKTDCACAKNSPINLTTWSHFDLLKADHTWEG